MKVLDLKCTGHGHAFEGWFGSEDDFQDQLQRGLVECPMCGDSDIRKQLSAPRLNISGAKAPAVQAPNPLNLRPMLGNPARPAARATNSPKWPPTSRR
jgi:hypothetical protein